ncbi:MAG TPA: hypothetical protein EYQ50_07845 [Verrucomicrobiales bacterium]|nr:hypothetical protein [Verrucomicrobiales bacterium]HIL68712.1 hypothetical protein [Verrucomicrobiota bacterium]
MKTVVSGCRDRQSLLLEILALRQQLMVWQRHNPKPKIRESDRVFWVLYSNLVKGWKDVVKIVQVENSDALAETPIQ